MAFRHDGDRAGLCGSAGAAAVVARAGGTVADACARDTGRGSTARGEPGPHPRADPGRGAGCPPCRSDRGARRSDRRAASRPPAGGAAGDKSGRNTPARREGRRGERARGRHPAGTARRDDPAVQAAVGRDATRAAGRPAAVAERPAGGPADPVPRSGRPVPDRAAGPQQGAGRGIGPPARTDPVPAQPQRTDQPRGRQPDPRPEGRQAAAGCLGRDGSGTHPGGFGADGRDALRPAVQLARRRRQAVASRRGGQDAARQGHGHRQQGVAERLRGLGDA
ncbi:secreted protein [marine sediment metagenome]|uniref:Secreted protein n=1 Tax=marine sediment metagenome TaxID=412755 RepID=A0A1B6NST9_9ZZZZ